MPEPEENRPKIVIVKNGCYRVYGNIPLKEEIIVSDILGIARTWKEGKVFTPETDRYSLCRCGQTKNPPFCDGTHKTISFDGTETAEKTDPFARAERIEGPNLVLEDAKHLCASARFCLASGGTWDLTRESDDPDKKETALREVHDCPAGRLVAKDKSTGKPIEPELLPSISIVEDGFSGKPGPIWVKGYVEIESSDGSIYEKRNRVTLCRCGRSKNKPFCDGTHVR